MTASLYKPQINWWNISPRYTNQTILNYLFSFCVTAVDSTAGNRWHVMFRRFLPCFSNGAELSALTGRKLRSQICVESWRVNRLHHCVCENNKQNIFRCDFILKKVTTDMWFFLLQDVPMFHLPVTSVSHTVRFLCYRHITFCFS